MYDFSRNPIPTKKFLGYPIPPRNFLGIPFHQRNFLGSPRKFQEISRVLNPNSKKFPGYSIPIPRNFPGTQSQFQEISRYIQHILNPNSKKFPGYPINPIKVPMGYVQQNSALRNLQGYIIPNPYVSHLRSPVGLPKQLSSTWSTP